MPGGDILVGEAGGDIKHDDGTLSMDVVPISQAAKLLLPSSIPAVEAKLPSIGSEVKRMHLNTNCCCKLKATLTPKSTNREAREATDERLYMPEECMATLFCSGPSPEKLTLILLLKFSCDMPLHKCCFSCKERGVLELSLASWRLCFEKCTLQSVVNSQSGTSKTAICI